VYHINKLVISIIFFVLFFNFSCEKSVTEPIDNNNEDPIDNDTSPPIITFTIEEGYEVSAEINLNIIINDESTIDSIFLYLDDVKVGSYVGNIDNLTFDTTPYIMTTPNLEKLKKTTNSSEIIDYERTIYLKAIDSEGNTGKSSIKNIVITEFPGWRKYYQIDETTYPICFLVDDNNLIWIGFDRYPILVYDPSTGNTRSLTIPTDINNDIVYDFELIGGSNVWIASENHSSKYAYDSDSWLEVLTPPKDNSHVDGDGNPILLSNSVHALALDNNNDLYIGSGNDDLFRYDGIDFTRFKLTPGTRIFPMDIHPDGTVYYFVQRGPQSYFKNDSVYVYDNYPWGNGVNDFLSMSLVIDNNGNVWCDTGFIGQDAQPGCYIWDGTDWSTLFTNNADEVIYPVLCDKNGIVYSEIWNLNTQSNRGIATYDGTDWTYWKDLETPFNTQLNDRSSIPSIGTEYSIERLIGEALNGDIWMIIDYTLWRYRPSLGGYPE